MPCFKRANGNRTPANIEYIRRHHLNNIEFNWRKHLKSPMPELPTADGNTVCLASLHADIAGCISSALFYKKDDSILTPEKIYLLKSRLPDLETVGTGAPRHIREHFNELLSMAKTLLHHCENIS